MGPVDAPNCPAETRPPLLVWLLVPLSCHLYGYYWWYAAGHELRDYLERDDLRPERDLALALVTCGLYAFFVLPFRFGRLIQEAQGRAGLTNPKNHGWGFCLAIFALYGGYGWMQLELNKVWAAATTEGTKGSGLRGEGQTGA